MEAWKSVMAGGTQTRSNQVPAGSGESHYRGFLTNYVNFCAKTCKMDLDLLSSSLHAYGKAGEERVSVESASFAAHWLTAILYLTVIDEDGIRQFLQEVIEHEKVLDTASEKQLEIMRKEQSGVRRLKHSRCMLAGCTVFSYSAMQSFLNILIENQMVLQGTALSRLADSAQAGCSPAERVRIGEIFSQAPYLLRALNYDPIFYQNLTERLGAAQKKYAFQPV